MEWLNYHHLLYFYTVAREGGLVPAARVLNLSHPTLSSQIRTLQESLEVPLFERSGRRLVLTEMGRIVYRYAEEIFGLGREMVDVLRGEGVGRAPRLDVGVADVVPKLVVRKLLAPAFQRPEPLTVVVHEGKAERLLADLALHSLDVVFADAPVGAGSRVKAYHHLLGESDVTFFAAPALAARHRRRFPQSLAGAPFLLPGEGTTLRRSLDQWMEANDVRPRRVAEVEDSALLKVLGGDGHGIFPALSILANDLRRQYGVRVVGRLPDIRERYYALTAERRLRHPAVAAICAAARDRLFG